MQHGEKERGDRIEGERAASEAEPVAAVVSVDRAIVLPVPLEFPVWHGLKSHIAACDREGREVSPALRAWVGGLGPEVFSDLGVGSPDSPGADTGSAGVADRMFATVTEISNRADVDRTHIGRLCTSGTLAAHKNAQGHWRIERHAVEVWLEQRRTR